jgi:hypothetical protein
MILGERNIEGVGESTAGRMMEFLAPTERTVVGSLLTLTAVRSAGTHELRVSTKYVQWSMTNSANAP